MEIHVLFKNLKADDDIKTYAEKKLGKLNKYLANIVNIKVELAEEKPKSRQHNFSAQVTLNVNGFLIRGEHRDESIKAAIDEVAEIVERQVIRYKKRFEVAKGRPAETIRVPADINVGKEDGEERAEVIKTKKFLIKPMTVEQAIDQMEFIGHDFFIFANMEDKSVNVLYRRKDGKYGLILPELA